jgi:hypothetical protein
VARYVSRNDIETTLRTGKCQCELCKSINNNNNIITAGGKPIPSVEEVQDMDSVYKRAEENKNNIQIIDDTFCVCMRCAARVRLLPPVNVLSCSEMKELQNRKSKLEAEKRGEILLGQRQKTMLMNAILRRVANE